MPLLSRCMLKPSAWLASRWSRMRALSSLLPRIQNFNSRMEVADDLIKRGRIRSAREILRSIETPENVPVSDAAHVFRKVLNLDFGELSRTTAIDEVNSIRDKFQLFSAGTSLSDDSVFRFYAELAYRYISLGHPESASQAISILKSAKFNQNDLSKQLWMQFETGLCEWLMEIHSQSFTKADSKLQSLITLSSELLTFGKKGLPKQGLVLDSFCALIKRVAIFYPMSKYHDQVCETVQLALKLLAEDTGVYSDHTVILKSYLAIAFANQGHSSKLIDICEDILSSKLPTNVDTARAISGLSELLLTSNPFKLSLSLKLSTLSIEILNSLDADSDLIALLYGTHGVILNAAQNFAEAKIALQKAASLLPKNHTRLHQVYHNLGSAYLGLREFEQAVHYLESAMEGYKIRGNKKLMAACFGHLGEVYEKLGRHDEAESAISDAVALKRDVIPGSTQLVVDLQNLAAMRQRSGLKQEAVDLHREAVAIVSQHFGEAHLQTACARRLLANALIGVKKIEEAIIECEKARPILEKNGSFGQYEHLIGQYIQLLLLVGRHQEANLLSQKLKSNK